MLGGQTLKKGKITTTTNPKLIRKNLYHRANIPMLYMRKQIQTSRQPYTLQEEHYNLSHPTDIKTISRREVPLHCEDNGAWCQEQEIIGTRESMQRSNDLVLKRAYIGTSSSQIWLEDCLYGLQRVPQLPPTEEMQLILTNAILHG